MERPSSEPLAKDEWRTSVSWENRHEHDASSTSTLAEDMTILS